MRRSHLSVIAALLLTTPGVSGALESDRAKDVAIQAASQFGQEMRQKLSDSLQQNEPAGALNICAKEAPAISMRLENELGVTIKRTSLKVRNPLNAPDAAETQLLEVLAGLHSKRKQLPQGVTEFPNDPGRYFKAITVEQSCLKCHGDSTAMSEALLKELAADYPEDKAVGYQEGAFRGIISITVK
jgi:hypothetical protein